VTHDEVMAMMPGPELDREVYRVVLGSPSLAVPTDINGHPFFPDDYLIPHYSADIAAAWLVAEEMAARGLRVVVEDWRDDTKNPGWAVYFFRQSGGSSKQIVAETLPLAVCRAALLAVVEGASS